MWYSRSNGNQVLHHRSHAHMSLQQQQQQRATLPATQDSSSSSGFSRSRLRSFTRLVLTCSSMGETDLARQTGSSSMGGSLDAAPAFSLLSLLLSRDNDGRSSPRAPGVADGLLLRMCVSCTSSGTIRERLLTHHLFFVPLSRNFVSLRLRSEFISIGMTASVWQQMQERDSRSGIATASE